MGLDVLISHLGVHEKEAVCSTLADNDTAL